MVAPDLWTRLMAGLKPTAAGLLLLVGGLCLGRVGETLLDRNPDRVGQRETITAGLLLGTPTTGGGAALLWGVRRDRHLREERHLRQVFFQLVKAGRGKVTALRFAMEAQIAGDRATAYLEAQARTYDATFQVDRDGGITYCFNLGEVDSRLLRPIPETRFDVVLEAIPPTQRRAVIRAVQHCTGWDWKAARAAVRTLPQTVQTGASQATAAELKRTLEAAGAQVAIVLRTD
jgi:hypothetical protein